LWKSFANNNPFLFAFYFLFCLGAGGFFFLVLYTGAKRKRAWRPRHGLLGMTTKRFFPIFFSPSSPRWGWRTMDGWMDGWDGQFGAFFITFFLAE
jgi:hypothetical protein